MFGNRGCWLLSPPVTSILKEILDENGTGERSNTVPEHYMYAYAHSGNDPRRNIELDVPFSSIFRDSLTKCQFRLGAGDTDALEELKEDEPFIPFQRIIDSLIDADRVGVEKAFVELTGDMEVSKKERELDTNTYINKKSGLASMLVFIPLLLLLFGYMIAPMMFTAFGTMNGFNTTIL